MRRSGTFNQWILHFFLINLILIYVLSFQYFDHVFPLKLYYFDKGNFQEKTWGLQLLLEFYLLMTFIGFFSFLTLFSLFPAFLLSCLTKRNWIPITGAILGMSGLFLVLSIDLKVFTLYRFHLNPMIFQMLLSPYRQEIFFFSNAEWILFYISVCLLLLFEITLALFLWFKTRFNWTVGIKRFAYLSMSLIIVSVYLTLNGNIYFIQQSTRFPFFNEIITPLLHTTKNQVNRYTTSHYFSAPQYVMRALQYPLHTIQCNKSSKPMNIFIILIDTWRFDAMNAQVTPYLNHFAENNLRFHHHMSGANATQPGVFSLFYGLPGIYWGAFHQAKTSPEFIRQLIQQQYQFAIFSSTNLKMPDFETTLFNLIPPTQAPSGDSSWERDKALTQQVLSFLQKNPRSQPIFSLIYYDAAHEYCGHRDFSGPFYPELKTCERYKLNADYNKTPYFNRYLNAVHALDQQINQIIQGIKTAGLWDDTIILITGDHGEEFNDNKMNYWGHASNFTKYQINVPLLIHWPRHQAQDFYHLTTHYDIVPTLMADALNCPSPARDYSLGINLFNPQNRYPVIVSNNYNAAYLTKKNITTLFPSGDIEISTPEAKLLPKEKPDPVEFQSVLKEITRFYR